MLLPASSCSQLPKQLLHKCQCLLQRLPSALFASPWLHKQAAYLEHSQRGTPASVSLDLLAARCC